MPYLVTILLLALPLQSGSTAAKELLAAARAEPDLARALALFDLFLVEHPERVSWCHGASRDAFRRMLEAPPGRVDDADLHAAALREARWSGRSAETYGNPSAHVVDLLALAWTLRERLPAAAVGFADRGEEYVRTMAPHTAEFGPDSAERFAPARLVALVALERWPEAEEAARTAVGSLAALHAVPETGRVPIDADEVRLAAAAALEQRGRIDEARALLWFVATTEPARADAHARFRERHPLDPVAEAAVEERLAEARARAIEAEAHGRRDRILATREDTPLEPLGATDLSGEPLALEGGTVVLTVWATWCVPCHWQLQDLADVALPGVRVVAASVDESRAEAARHAAELELPYEWAHVAGEAAETLGAATGIPKLFVVRDGRIRFRTTGHDRGSGERFRQELGWMLEALDAASD